MSPILRRIVQVALVLFLLAVLGAAAGHYYLFRVLPASDEDADRFSRTAITTLLSGETRVYYRDGSTQLGAFFDVNHRVYVPYDSIPLAVIHALVAAEDARFFEHGGVDFKGLTRAMWNNLKSRRMVQGGSSLTQQTAKNIFGREDRSFGAKWQELKDALRLEHHFNKEDILEFYLNQFYVSGTGRGLAIAAWHFFSKDLRELSLAECAFIAGSVKGPAKYDPFGKRTVAQRERALEEGRRRLGYVLGRMLQEGYITAEQHQKALATPLNFQMGHFRFALTTHLARLEERLESPFFQALFDSLGIESWQKAQLDIVTTLDPQLQGEARRGLQTNLSNLQMRLDGHVAPGKDTWPTRRMSVHKGDFLYGKLDTVLRDSTGQLRELRVSFGQLQGIVARSELEDYAKHALASGGVRHRSDAAAIGNFIKKYAEPGRTILVMALDSAGVGEPLRLRPASQPTLQGALVAVQDGELRASQGGFDNTGYDRSFQARRQFGSAWKPLLYALALDRGWNYLDELDNEWNLFSFMGQYYFPRPDHTNKGDFVSLAWAAALSENIASVWLLDQLHQRLPTATLLSLARERGHLQRDGEARESFLLRLRDTLGLIPNQNAREEIEFVRARENLATELILEGDAAAARNVRRIHWGQGWEAEAKKQGRVPWNRQQLEHNWKRYYGLLQKRLSEEGRSMELPPEDSVRVGFGLTLAHIKRLVALVRPVDAASDPTAEGNIIHWPDWRRSLAMHDFVAFLASIGVRSPVQPVLSMPLGANDVSLAEIAVAYQTILTGLIWKCRDGDWNDVAWIREIRDGRGRVIFQNSCESQRVLSPAVTAQVALFLRAVVTDGTGRSAQTPLSIERAGLGSLYFPAVGKTGTTNDYRNVAFVGALPLYDTVQSALSFRSALSIASYVGNDDNRPLRSGAVRIAGSSGGLPQWIHFAAAAIDHYKMAESVDFLDLNLQVEGSAPLYLPGRNGFVQVSARTGLPPASGDSTESLTRIPLLESSHEVSPY